MVIFYVGLIALILASITDLKKREVPDWINFGLIFFGLSFASVLSLNNMSFEPIFNSLLGLGAGFAIGALMFYTGQWGGGDAKMLMGLGSLFGIKLSLFDTFININFNILIAGAFYGILFGVYLAIKHSQEFVKQSKILSVKYAYYRKIAIILSTLFLGVAIFTGFRIHFASLAILSIITYYLFIYIKSVEDACMIKYVKSETLVEGDWIVDEVKIPGKIFMKKKVLDEKDIEKISKYQNGVDWKVRIKRYFITMNKNLSQLEKNDVLLDKISLVKTGKLTEKDIETVQIYLRKNLINDAKIRGKSFSVLSLKKGQTLEEDLRIDYLVCGPNDLGLEWYQVREIQRLKLKEVKVKEGIPFIPSFLIAYLMTFYLPSLIGLIAVM